MATKTNRKSRNRRILILAVAVFLLLVSVLAYNSWLHRPSTRLQASSDYFDISDLAATCYVVGNSSAFNDTYLGTMILINDFGFNFTPVNGTATDVRIFASGDFNTPRAADWEGIVIPNGTSTFSGELMPTYPIPSHRQSDGTYTLRVRIASVEADGYITLNFTADNLVSLGPQPT